VAMKGPSVRFPSTSINIFMFNNNSHREVEYKVKLIRNAIKYDLCIWMKLGSR
jgi:hypothetical protein